MARRPLELQYNLEIHHMSAASNYLADVLSRNPAHVNAADINYLTKPNSISVNALDLKIGHASCKNFKTLSTLQWSRPTEDLNAITSQPTTTDHKYRPVQDILYCKQNGGVKGSQLGHTGVTALPRGDTGGPLEGSRYLPGVTDAEYSLSSPKTVCAWQRAITYKRRDPVCAEHSGSKGVNLQKQSPILWCECRAYGMNGSGLDCLKRHPLGYRANSQR